MESTSFFYIMTAEMNSSNLFIWMIPTSFTIGEKIIHPAMVFMKTLPFYPNLFYYSIIPVLQLIIILTHIKAREMHHM